ncbi:phage terminase small subunit P27 family [Pseudaestuariivita rosea]|uniref:phage terminase small subunit P27 family n=1 Tax=Pseudaestuariivita rosea TaxID=2763263 RepID=UPI001ABA4535|nr:phage terminase small subunit P27 family [Pseudaestuariivita rosea]
MKGQKLKLSVVVPMKGDETPEVPQPPDWMTGEGRAVWVRLAEGLVAKGRLAPCHEDLFAAYCEAAADYVRATACLALEGMYYTVQTRNGHQEKKRAAWGLRQDALANMRQVGALFGMSPVDEARLQNTDQGDLFRDLMEQLNGSD